MPKAYYFYIVNYLGCVNPDNDIKFIYYINIVILNGLLYFAKYFTK